MKQRQSSIWKSNHTLTEKLLRLPLRLIPSNAKLRVRSGVNKGLLWVAGASVHKCWIGSYEQERQQAVTKTLREGMTAWDIGANVGFYTLAFSRAVGRTGKVVAFEPDGLNAAYLLEHVLLNELENVTVVQAAVSNATELISFSVGTTSSLGRILNTSAYRIPSISVDTYIESNNGVVPDLIKIDVEGAEARVLEGASKLLTEHHPEIWLALHGQEAMQDCTRLLKGYGYAIYALDGTTLDEITTSEVIARKG